MRRIFAQLYFIAMLILKVFNKNNFHLAKLLITLAAKKLL